LRAAIDGGFVPAVKDIGGRGQDGRLIPFDDLARSCGGPTCAQALEVRPRNGEPDDKSHCDGLHSKAGISKKNEAIISS